MPTKEGPYSKPLGKNEIRQDDRVDSSGNFKEKPKSWADVLDGSGVNDGLSGKLPKRK